MFFHLQNSNSRMARTIHIDGKSLESEKPNTRPLEVAMRRFGAVHSVVLMYFFSHSPVGPANKIVSEIKLQLRTLRRNVWWADIGKSITVEGYLFCKRYHEALRVHAHFGHWLSRWSADLVRNSSGPSIIRDFQQNQTSKAYACWAKMQVAVGFWVGMHGCFSVSTNRKNCELC